MPAPTKLSRRRARLIAAEVAAFVKMRALTRRARVRLTKLAAELVAGAESALPGKVSKSRARKWVRTQPQWTEMVEVVQVLHSDITAVSVGLSTEAARMGAEPFGTLTKARALAYTTEAADELAKMLRAGSPLNRLLREAAGDAVDEVSGVLTDAVVLRLHPRKTATLMRKALDGTPGAPGMTARRALMIARTEQHRAYREGCRDAWSRDPYVSGWRWVCALDRRSCAACWAMHGTEHTLDEPMGSHPSCRCVMEPVTVDDLRFPTGAEEFARLDPGDQDRILRSHTLGNAYRDGVISFDDTVTRTSHPEWGPGIKRTNVRDLIPDAAERARYRAR